LEQNQDDIIIKCKCRLSKQMFPKNKIISNGDFGIISVTVLDTLQGEPQINKWGTITLKGTKWCNEISDDEIYIVIGKENEDEKYGLQYEVVFMCVDVKLTNRDDQFIFLEKVLPEKQCVELFKAFENPIEILESKDIQALTSVKGIGVPTAIKLIERYENSKDYSEAYVKLDKYGLTKNKIDKLVDYYGSPHIVISKIEENPYILIDEVDGIGWDTADDMALQGGLGEYSLIRTKAYVKYYLYEQANMGNTWVDIDDLLSAVDGIIGYDLPQETLSQALREMNESNIIWTNEDRDKVGLLRYYNLENNIAKELIRLNKAENCFKFEGWQDKIKKLEEKQKWEFSSEQIEGIKAILENQIVMITGSAGCVDCDTEYFNGTEWKKISDYKEGEKVLQFNENRTANLIPPYRYIKEPCDEMTHVKSTKGKVNQVLTDDHTFIYLTGNNKIQKKPFSEIKETHLNNLRGFYGSIMTSFKYEGKGISLSDIEIRIMIAIYADGSFPNQDYNLCRLHLQKQRKIDRITQLLNKANINYKIQTFDSAKGVFVVFNAPRKEKHFEKYWYECSYHQKEIIIDEIFHWDGYKQFKQTSQYCTICKKDADFIQFVFSSMGYRSTILTDTETLTRESYVDGKVIKGTHELYRVYKCSSNPNIKILGDNRVNYKDKAIMIPYKTLDGFKYCFTVPSGMLVLRRNNKIFITGNCGKSSTVAGVLEIFKENYSFAQTALSGRASCNLSDITGLDGYTIHRLLGYNPESGFVYNKDNPLYIDICILDEISMVGADIYYKLIQALKTGSKLVMLGDKHQLEAIGIGNIMFDMIESDCIKVVELTKIHRQAEKSAIITNSIKIKDKEHIVDKDFTGTEIRGELQDLELDIYINKDTTHRRVVEHFKELLPKTENIFDIQVIVPMKERGKASAYYLNNLLQEIVINTNTDQYISVGENSKYPFKIYIGDKVLNNKNNYKTMDDNANETPIFNGDLGIVVDMDIYRRTLIVDFNNKGIIYIPKSHLKKITLGYVATCHKIQGMGIKYVIAGLDYSHYKLLTKEMVYTMLTRAKEYCVLCAENKALRYATKQTSVSTKQTHLKNMLIELNNIKIA